MSQMIGLVAKANLTLPCAIPREMGANFRSRRTGRGCHSYFDALARLSENLQTRGDDAVGKLLAAAIVPSSRDTLPSDGVWTQEALHRAYSMVRLFLRLHARQKVVNPLNRIIENRLAEDISRILNAYRSDTMPTLAHCASDMRDIVRGLVALFGPAVGDIEVQCDIERVKLPPVAQRTLVLLSQELVVNALLHAFSGRHRGWIAVRLCRSFDGYIHLRVEDDGIGFPADASNRHGVAYMLASRLDAAISHARSASGVTCVDVAFRPDLPTANTCPREIGGV